ncbi:MAG TPA: glutamate-5-semialdehyde dehydrogenase [Clostridiales bacterium]|nr:glutamate-5-semialdehyde dehydrogenase [Clostridiales bacterium]
MNAAELIKRQGEKARAAARFLAVAGQNEKNRALTFIADALLQNIPMILAENEKDIKAAESAGMRPSLLDRLRLTPARIEAMAAGVRELVAAADPVNEVIHETVRPNGLRIGQKRVPLGVIGIIFEARPNVTVDAAALCLKAGNACILRGGREALNSNMALSNLMRSALESAGLPADCVYLLEDTTRDGANAMMRASGILDVLIPRGGAGLIRAVVENATVPVIETGVGNCHVYVEASAKPDMAVSIVNNAKTSRPSVCNAAETLLVDRKCAKMLLPPIVKALEESIAAKNETPRLYGCAETRDILGEKVSLATEEDYFTEYLDYSLAIKVVSGVDEAIAHIAKYGSGHSDAIVTSDYFIAERFLNEVDAAAVYVNASTRFTDGGEFGLGAEIGISTQKLHARGPMGLAALTTIKFVVRGEGQIR